MRFSKYQVQLQGCVLKIINIIIVTENLARSNSPFPVFVLSDGIQCTVLVSVDEAAEVPVSPPDKNEKIRTWGPSSVHQRDREKSRRVKAKDRFMAERCNSVPNLGTQVNQNGGKKV